jgi:hypothetical protein
MAKFKEVFSTTSMVLVALLLIAIGVGLGWSIIHHLSSSTSISGTSRMVPQEEELQSGSRAATGNKYLDNKEYYDRLADDRPTSVQQSRWNKTIAAAVKVHCPFEGMTKQQLEQSIGKPYSSSPTPSPTEPVTGTPVPSTVNYGEAWEYRRENKKKCLKYVGDKCAEFEQQAMTFYFTPLGHMVKTKFPFDYWSAHCWGDPFNSTYYRQENWPPNK